MDGCMHASECTANAPIISEILQQSALSKEMKDRKRTLWSFCIYVFPLKLQLKTSFRRSYCSRFVLLACVRLKCVIQNQKGAKGPYMLSAKVKSNNNNNDWTHCHKAFIFVCYSRFIASSSTPFFYLFFALCFLLIALLLVLHFSFFVCQAYQACGKNREFPMHVCIFICALVYLSTVCYYYFRWMRFFLCICSVSVCASACLKYSILFSVYAINPAECLFSLSILAAFLFGGFYKLPFARVTHTAPHKSGKSDTSLLAFFIYFFLPPHFFFLVNIHMVNGGMINKVNETNTDSWKDFYTHT